MRSATSFFNRPLLRRQLLHFWPLWVLYTLVWSVLLPLPIMSDLLSRYVFRGTVWTLARRVGELGGHAGIFLALLFAIPFAMSAFTYLTVPRATQGFHAMPVRRETLFVTNYCAGLIAMLAAPLLAFTLTGVTLAATGYLYLPILLESFAAAALTTLFFYSFAVLCMIFVGQILAAPVFYGILNFLAIAVEYLLRQFAGSFLYGYRRSFGSFAAAPLSPVCYLNRKLSAAEVCEPPAGGPLYEVTGMRFVGLGVCAIYAVVGLVLAALALLLYRRRASEETGSIVAIRWARPLFKYGVAFCSAISFGQFVYYILVGSHLSQGNYSLSGTIACMIFTGLLGYFAAEMLLKKRFRVLRASWIGAAAVAAVLVLLGVGMSLDLTGYERRVPAVDEIEAVYVDLWCSDASGHGEFTEEETLRAVTALHSAIVADKERQLAFQRTPASGYGDSPERSYAYVQLKYTLKNGAMVQRSYDSLHLFRDDLRDPNSIASAATAVLNTPEVCATRFLGQKRSDERSRVFTGGFLAPLEEALYPARDLTAAQAKELYEMLQRDLYEGNAGNVSLFGGEADDTCANLELYYNFTTDLVPDAAVTLPGQTTIDRSTSASRSLHIVVTHDMPNTVAALERICNEEEHP